MHRVELDMVASATIPNGRNRNDKPNMMDLCEHIVTRYAARWKELGLELGLKEYIIDNIHENNARHPRQVEECCTAVLRQWLKEIPSPSWGKLDDAIVKIVNWSSSDEAISTDGSDMTDIQGFQAANEISSHLKTSYIATRFTPDKDEWPPEQPKEYTTLALIHHHSQPTQDQIVRLARAKAVGSVDRIIAAASNQLVDVDDFEASLKKCLQESKATCDISDILAPLEEPDDTQSRIVLIEGAPGLGKTVMLKQIAYEWAQNKLLINSFLVFLVTLRDPAIQKMNSVSDLLQYYCRHIPETSKACVDYIFKVEGKNVTILLDGYDELPFEMRQDSFIGDIINHRVLPLAAVVITSRPHASACLRSYVTCHVDILGFSKVDQHRYFQKSLEGQPDKLYELLKYLDNHPTINSLCFVPFNMTVLLWLFKQGVHLPNSSADLYNCFICHTIRHHLAKAKVSLRNITDLNSLPQPYKEIIQQLSVLCLKALDKNQLVFTLQEIKSACPKIETIHGAINAFGLLQAIEHYSIDPQLMGTPTKTLNFVHSSVQEFLAAYQISCLSYRKGLRFIKNKFFSDFYSNTFALYVGITKGQSASFKRYLSTYGKSIFSFFSFNSNRIAKKFLQDERTCLRLFKYFHEADDPKACINVTEKFNSNRKIDLFELQCYDPFLPSDIQCLALFLSASPTSNWEMLNLCSCNIGDAGIRLLHQSLVTSDVIIDHIDLSNNSLTSQSAQEIAEIVIHCEVSVLNLTSNSLGDSRLLERIFSKYSTIEKLFFGYNNLSSASITALFSALNKSKNTKLRELDLHCNNCINDAAVTEITTFLRNNTLTYLNLLAGNISGISVQNIVESLMNNTKLSCLYLSTSCSDDDTLHKIGVKVRSINEKRSLCGCEPLEVHCYPAAHRCQLYELDI